MKRKTYYATQLKRAAHMLFFKQHQKPGVRGWELSRTLGTDYQKVIALLDRYLEKLDLKVKTVFEEGKPKEKPTRRDLERARFCVTLRGGLTSKDAKMMGWRIDDIAGLAITLSLIISKKGKASREEVETLLREKLPGWRVCSNIDRYIRAGYVDQDEGGYLYLDWRTRAEIDEKELLNLLLGEEETWQEAETTRESLSKEKAH